MKIIFLTRNKEVLVDDDDYELLKGYHWQYNSNYAVRGVWNPITDNIGKILMHRQIMTCAFDLEVDHINGNKLDNRKENLRICTRSQNQANRSKLSNNTSGYKGVHFDSKKKRFVAQITYQGKKLHLGYYKTVEEANQAYNIKATNLFGEFSYAISRSAK